MEKNLLNNGSVNNNEMHETEVVPMKKLFNKVIYAKTDDTYKKARLEVIKRFVTDDMEKFDEEQIANIFSWCIVVYKIMGKDFKIDTKTSVENLKDIFDEIFSFQLDGIDMLGLYALTRYAQPDKKSHTLEGICEKAGLTHEEAIRYQKIILQKISTRANRESLGVLFDSEYECLDENLIFNLTDIPGYAKSILLANNIKTIDDLCQLTEDELKSLKASHGLGNGLGQKSIDKIFAKLNELGRSLKKI